MENTLNNKTRDLTADSARMFAEIYSKADILFLVLNLNGEITHANVTFQEKLEYEPKSLVGKNFLDFILESDHPAATKMLKTCASRGYVRDVAIQFVDVEGKILYCDVNGLVESDDEGNPQQVRLFIKDVHEQTLLNRQQRIAQIVLQYSAKENISTNDIQTILEALYTHFNCGWVGLSAIDKTGEYSHFQAASIEDDQDGSDHFQHWKPEQWVQFVNKNKEDKAAHFESSGAFWTPSLSSLVLEVEKAEDKELFSSLIEYESLLLVPVSNEWIKGYLILIHPHGFQWDNETVMFLEPIGRLLGLAFKKEIKPVSEAFQWREQNWLDIPEMGMVVLDNGSVQYANKWLLETLGWNKNEVVGMDITSLTARESQEVVQKILQADLSSEVLHVVDSLFWNTNSGHMVKLSCSAAHVQLQGQMVQVWYLILNEDHPLLNEQLVQTRRMELLGMLVSGIVHDFNNLLATILGYSSLLQEEVKENSPHYRDIQELVQTSERATKLTSRLLAFAQGKSFIIPDLNINPLISEVAGILSRTLDRKVTIQAELEPKLYAIRADAGQVQQAILHVALNGKDAMPNGGKLLFQTRNVTIRENDPRLRSKGKPGKYIQINISDTGGGMSNKIKDQIFDPNFSTKDNEPGKGLGLAIVQDVVDKHGGFVSVFSESGRGTIFKIYLPAIEVHKKASGVDAVEKPLLGKETILLVDDEKVLRDTARRMLTRYGYKVMNSESGTEAVAIYKKHVKRIHLIILDLIMPGVEINKIIKWLLKLNPDVKIIATVGLGEKDPLEKEVRSKLVDVIQKPFQVRPLLKSIRSAIHE